MGDETTSPLQTDARPHYSHGEVPHGGASTEANTETNTQYPHNTHPMLVPGVAIVATLFATAAALGIAAMQIGTGVSIVSGRPR